MVENYTIYQFTPFRATDWTVSMYLAEEEGGGKALLLEKGAYEGIDVCIMYACASTDLYTLAYLTVHTNRTHPVSGPPSSALIISSLARQSLDVEYHGKP